jgi:hypothetical protein
LSTPVTDIDAFFKPVVNGAQLIVPILARGERHGLRASKGIWRATAREILEALDGTVTAQPIVKLPPAPPLAPLAPAAESDAALAARHTARQAKIERAYVAWLGDEQLGLTRACRLHGVDYTAALRDFAIRKLGLAQYQRLSALRGHRPHGPRKEMPL